MKRPICNTPRCKNKARKKGLDCATCNKKKWRKKYPMKASYAALRDNARRRHKPFTITYEEFEAFCYKVKFIVGNGRTKQSHSVDRKINELGYVSGNLQKLTLSENARKGTKKLYYDWRTGEATVA